MASTVPSATVLAIRWLHPSGWASRTAGSRLSRTKVCRTSSIRRPASVASSSADRWACCCTRSVCLACSRR